jgi:hypothetical protein
MSNEHDTDPATTGTSISVPPSRPSVTSGATGPNPLAEAVPNSPPDVSPNPAPGPDDDLDSADLATLERRLREAISRAERGTELLEDAIRRRRQRR